eukprot:m.11944 g.11944  ORF g.11944 m.11944 type:complete len:385 (+) comp5908_c0_seq1:135-1289(+)
MSGGKAAVIAVLGGDRRVHCGQLVLTPSADGSTPFKCSVSWFLLENSAVMPSPIISAPEVVIFQGLLHVFVVCTDKIVYHTHQLPAERGRSWSAWNPVSDRVTSDPPSTAVFRNELYVFMRSGGDHVSVRTLSAEGKWGAITELLPKCGVSACSPAAASVGDALHVFTRGLDDRLYANVLAAPPAALGVTSSESESAPRWLGWHVFPGGATSGESPCAAAVESAGRVVVLVRGRDSRVHWASSAATRATSGGAASGWTGFVTMPSVPVAGEGSVGGLACVEVPTTGGPVLLAVARDTLGALHHTRLGSSTGGAGAEVRAGARVSGGATGDSSRSLAPEALAGAPAPAGSAAPSNIGGVWTAWEGLEAPGLIAAGPSLCVGELNF